MSDVFIYDHLRTPRGRGKKDGSLHSVTAIELATQVLGAMKERNGLHPGDVDDVIFGLVLPVGEQGGVLPRLAALQAGYGEYTSGLQVDRFCGSGLEACNIAAAQVLSGSAALVIGGGVESMSRVPMDADGGAWAIDPKIASGQYFVPQGISADIIATKWNYSREAVDAYAAESHRRAALAWQNDYFRNSVITVKDVFGRTVLDRDETIRPSTTAAILASLKPSFADQGKRFGFDAIALQRYPELERIHHVHHAGNSSGIVDGSAAVLIGNASIGQKLGVKPRARIRAWASIGSEPTIMLTGPSFAAEKALRRAGMHAKDIDLWEINEAFAAVVLRCMDALEVPHEKTNVNGGAIAMGHPLGATGAMILGAALDELERRGQQTALITLCIGAGMGVATIIERI